MSEDTAPRRRIGAESSETRAVIVAATEAVIREEGYAAASTRRVALRAGIKPSLVHYYFPTTDDLLLAVFEKGAAQSEAMLDAALDCDDPVAGLWRFLSDDSRVSLSVEYIALAIRRPAIRERVAAHSEAMRARQVAMLERALGQGGKGLESCPPAGLSLILAGIGRALFMEQGLDIAAGHAEARAWIGQWLAGLTAQK
jgi:AcrR family transcriptional regulator